MSTSVFFFGGYKAMPDQVDRWVKSARAQKPDIDSFSACPWPIGAAKHPKHPADGEVGVSVFKQTGQFEKVVDAIQASRADKIFIVGHSSGCAIANEVDRALKGSKVASKLVLVCLDGYRPHKDQLKRDNTQVWGAVSGAHKSLHYPKADEKRQLGKKFKEYTAKTDCTTQYALHFSLVNTVVTNDTGNLEHGYDDCQANLKWVDEDLKLTTP